LSLQPFEHPLCTREGIIFDLMNIMPYLKKYGHSPVTGEPMDARSLIKLTFYKNSEGVILIHPSIHPPIHHNLLHLDQFHCPITFKVFNENSTIVTIANTGNVYSYEVSCQLSQIREIQWLMHKYLNMYDLTLP
jgi:hypothetical protein